MASLASRCGCSSPAHGSGLGSAVCGSASERVLPLDHPPTSLELGVGELVLSKDAWF